MNKKFLAMTCSLLLISASTACKKKEEEPLLIPKTVMSGQQQPAQHRPELTIQKGETNVVVPHSVKMTWKGVVLVVKDKTTQKTEEFTVNLHSDFKVPGSDIRISIGDFLPDFKMNGQTITSLSNEPNNPSVRVKVFENDKKIFEGWIYSEFPNIHPFGHPKYNILLKNGVKK